MVLGVVLMGHPEGRGGNDAKAKNLSRKLISARYVALKWASPFSPMSRRKVFP